MLKIVWNLRLSLTTCLFLHLFMQKRKKRYSYVKNQETQFLALWTNFLQNLAKPWNKLKTSAENVCFFIYAPSGAKSPYRKMWSPKGVNKMFPSQRNTNRWKTLVAIFFKNQSEENAFGASMAVFRERKRFEMQTLWWFIHLSLKNHLSSFVRLPNVWNQLYKFSCARLKNCCLVLCSMFKDAQNDPEGSSCCSH